MEMNMTHRLSAMLPMIDNYPIASFVEPLRVGNDHSSRYEPSRCTRVFPQDIDRRKMLLRKDKNVNRGLG